ncbi:sensor histidine kinase [Ideonella paludis]|uniref:histidine kinase n=1 Tax=Ideonella paludis TaxID=1233411 RepID=A0ABS5DRP8_9BURK|nr:histidine kinase [Ideonella paludis]MBQ0933815.1 histidine kinase [Ideonella paludis]
MNTTSQPPLHSSNRWQRFARATVQGFHAYANWLVSITWRRFAVLSVLLLILAAILQEVPPFSWRFTETIEHPVTQATPPKPKPTPKAPEAPKPPELPASEASPVAPAEVPSAPAKKGPGLKIGGERVDITIDENGVRILSREKAAAASGAAASAASAPQTKASEGQFGVVVNHQPVVEITAGDKGVKITLPPGADAEAVREAIDQARQDVVEALEAEREVEEDLARAVERGRQVSTREVRLGDALPQLAFLWIVASIILKITYKGRMQAEVKAAQATETAEAESLRRQVLEARVAAMQAQVEPHFLFNTLASIDFLIETDPPRASQMQKNLIALLRASMPTMRDTHEGGSRDLGRELAVVRPYVEILKVRMEERLEASIEVPEGLLSAEFPAMMIQTLVENAIRHGLEPKAEGGSLRIAAEIIHGKLSVTVADTGVGFGNAATAGTGVGLANIRERLQLLYGNQASVTVVANQPCGTKVTLTVPYKTLAAEA